MTDSGDKKAALRELLQALDEILRLLRELDNAPGWTDTADLRMARVREHLSAVGRPRMSATSRRSSSARRRRC